MPRKNSFRVFVQKSMTGSRMLWLSMYTFFFILGWASVYSTETCKNMYLMRMPELVSRGIYVALGFIVYCLLFLFLRLIHIIHQAMKERMDSVKVAYGAEIVDLTMKFLRSVPVTLLFVYLDEILSDKPAIRWTCISLVGSLLCLLMVYINPLDYGLSDAFWGLWMGVGLNLGKGLKQAVVMFILLASLRISRMMEDETRNANEVRVAQTTYQKG